MHLLPCGMQELRQELRRMAGIRRPLEYEISNKEPLCSNRQVKAK